MSIIATERLQQIEQLDTNGRYGRLAREALEALPVTFQGRVAEWMKACFSIDVCRDGIERNHRFLEESLELVQSLGCTASEAHQLVDYVFGRPVGEPKQEMGGVMVTLAALACAHDLDMMPAAETELVRVWTRIDQIRAKQATKPKHSPLPQHVEADAGTAQAALQEIIKSASHKDAINIAIEARREYKTSPAAPVVTVDMSAELMDAAQRTSKLRDSIVEACDLLAERKYGSPARSPGHNARLLLERALENVPKAPATPGADAARTISELRAGLQAAIRAAKLALFVVRKQNVMPNGSWANGFDRDLEAADAALAGTPQHPDLRVAVARAIVEVTNRWIKPNFPADHVLPTFDQLRKQEKRLNLEFADAAIATVKNAGAEPKPERQWTGPGHLEQTGYIDPEPGR
ncbi:hypothetical protein HAP48_0043140 [Bradyrhizobium septentrionale]|uniref:hypothetical protein n=1 Tax=Bradyrhizobium septentrionale TaxID=1404411 RepID=UPI001AEE8277|nr:hypothetical protein [Bradyrhizobium septentrionale]UGY15255.1 hypothetical protein HAP48_0043140 [Bradyrhizobium septentrionale]UGY23842.1 hypothetical protein HU675_0038825 [Bradyrhizobium septentrionale]